MRRASAAAVAAALLALAAATTSGQASQRGLVGYAGCGSQSIAGFPHAYTSAGNIRVGPLAFVGALRNSGSSPQHVDYIGGIKSPAVLKPGHTATASIARADRDNVRLAYGRHRGSTQNDFAIFPHTIHFKSCSRKRAGSNADGRPVTFWSGFFVIKKSPTCIHVNVSIDGRRARQRTIPVAQPNCP